MSETTLSVTLIAGLLLVTWGANAQDTAAADAASADQASAEVESNLSWNIAITSDYVYRGVTQSHYGPALQGGLNYAFGESGIYVGAWSSNVDFADGAGPEVELDTYVGYTADLSEEWTIDLMLTRYSYLGSGSEYGDINFNQLDANISYKEALTFTTSYSNDYGNGGYSYRYYGLSGNWEVGRGVSLNATAGHTLYSDGNGSYNDFSVGAKRQFGRVNAILKYIDTDIEGERASDRLVLTLSIEV